MELIQYIRLFKFRYHLSFICVIVGSLILAEQPLYTIIKPLLIVYLSFNVLLYGGLYTLNDIADIEADSRHPEKKNRPLPSKKISVASAYIFAFVCMLIGLIIAYFYFGRSMFLLYASFIFVNQIYTHVAKKIPYFEILFNSLTYPMRFFLGILLVTDKIPYFLIFSIFLFAFGLACQRRVIERRAPGWEARRVLKHYTEAKLIIFQVLALAIIVAVSIVDYPLYSAWYIIMILLYLIFVFGIHFSNYFLNFYKWLWLR